MPGDGGEPQLANTGLVEYRQSPGFATGQVARIDLRAETATIVNAGHPPPLRLRNGSLEAVPLEADPPFGAFADSRYRVQSLPLEAGGPADIRH